MTPSEQMATQSIRTSTEISEWWKTQVVCQCVNITTRSVGDETSNRQKSDHGFYTMQRTLELDPVYILLILQVLIWH